MPSSAGSETGVEAGVDPGGDPGIDLATVGTLFRYELRSVVRDRRTLLVAVVLPMLVIPLFFFLSRKAEESREERKEETVYRYAVVGEAAAAARELLHAAETAEDGASSARLEEVAAEDPEADLAAERVALYLEALPAVDGSGAGEPPLFRLVYQGNREASSTAAGEISERLERGRRRLRAERLGAAGFPVAPGRVAELESRDLASAEQLAGATLGRFATLFALIFLLTGGSVVAADTLAGEKERGTLETLLTTGAGRLEIVWAKQLLILAVGMAVMALQLAELLLLARLELFELPAGLEIVLSPATGVLVLLLLLPLAAMVASGLLLLSGRARSYKEFQLYFFPVFLVGLLPALAAALPGLSLRSAVALVPIAGTSVAVREVLMGRVDLPMLALVLASSAGVAWAGLRLTQRALATERLITAGDLDRAELEGGPGLFPRRVLRSFAAMWVVIFLASASGLLPSLQGQLLFNLGVVFLGGSLLLVRRYRLPVRHALALRPVRPAVWLAVLLGAPASYLGALAVARLSLWLFPLPARMLEELGRGLLPEELPLWQLLLLVAVLPGVCEEIAFRGVLLHGLRKRFRPVVLCLVVGAIFGLFHFQLSRLLPTAVLGVVVSALTLLTGSIFPAMLWHALSNATAILAARAGFEPFDLPAWTYSGGVAITLAAFWIVWRCRTPYPGLAEPRGPT